MEVSATLQDAIRYGLSGEERARLGLLLSDADQAFLDAAAGG